MMTCPYCSHRYSEAINHICPPHILMDAWKNPSQFALIYPTKNSEIQRISLDLIKERVRQGTCLNEEITKQILESVKIIVEATNENL